MNEKRTEKADRALALIGRTITSIAPAGGRDVRLKVRVGRRVAAVLRRRDVEELGLVEGMVIDAALIEALREREVLGRAMDAAMRWLARKRIASGSLAQRLAERGFEVEVVSHTMARLTDAGLLDNEALARDIAAGLRRRGPAGPRLIRETLARRGIDSDLAERIARESTEGRDIETEARRLIAQRLASMGGLPPKTRARRLLGLLARRGIEPDLADRLVQQALRHAGESPESN